MKRFRMRMLAAASVTLLLFAVLNVAGCSNSSYSGSGNPDYGAVLQRMVAEKWDAYGQSIGHPQIGGAALYISSPKGNYFASTNMDNAGPDIHFRAASNTKTFTAAAIMLLYQRGQLNIDDLITAQIPGKDMSYVPDSPSYAIRYKDSITIRQLIGHRAGVFDVTNSEIPEDAPCRYAGQDYVSLQESNHQFTFDELIGVVAECKLSYWEPWLNKYHYSNTGYNLLGKIIERVSGMSYSDFITENLIRPNNLLNTSSPHLASDTRMPDPFAVGYSLDGGVISAVDEDNMSANVSEGNIVSTPSDLSKWIKNLISGTAGIEKKYVDMMKDCTPEAGAASCYGLGIVWWEGLGYGHTGAHNGYLSIMSYDPAKDVSAVLFFSLLNGDNINGEVRVLIDVSLEAKKILGY